MSKAAQDRLDELEALMTKPSWSSDDVRELLAAAADRRRAGPGSGDPNPWLVDPEEIRPQPTLGETALQALEDRAEGILTELVDALGDRRGTVRRFATLVLAHLPAEAFEALTTHELAKLMMGLKRRTEPTARMLRTLVQRLYEARRADTGE